MHLIGLNQTHKYAATILQSLCFQTRYSRKIKFQKGMYYTIIWFRVKHLRIILKSSFKMSNCLNNKGRDIKVIIWRKEKFLLKVILKSRWKKVNNNIFNKIIKRKVWRNKTIIINEIIKNIINLIWTLA